MSKIQLTLSAFQTSSNLPQKALSTTELDVFIIPIAFSECPFHESGLHSVTGTQLFEPWFPFYPSIFHPIYHFNSLVSAHPDLNVPLKPVFPPPFRCPQSSPILRISTKRPSRPELQLPANHGTLRICQRILISGCSYTHSSSCCSSRHRPGVLCQCKRCSGSGAGGSNGRQSHCQHAAGR